MSYELPSRSHPPKPKLPEMPMLDMPKHHRYATVIVMKMKQMQETATPLVCNDICSYADLSPSGDDVD